MATQALEPPRREPLLSWSRVSRLALPATVLVTLLFELALAERKYAIFGGGFGQPRTLDAPLETGLFLAGLIACQIVLLALIHRLLRRLHGRHTNTPLFTLNFLCLGGGFMLAAITAKYQALAYFSDAMSFQIVRNLGGGSLSQALLYSLSDAGLMLIALGGFLLLYAGALLVLKRRWRESQCAPAAMSGRTFVALAVALPILLLAASRHDDVRPALARFLTPAAFTFALHQLSDVDRDGWSLYSWPVDRHPFDASRHPYALDVPGNGVDEDGFGGDLQLEPQTPAAPTRIEGRRRHVILIVLESTRADLLGRRIDGRLVAPALEALAAQGSVAREAYSHVGFTTQSLRSLFTGRLDPAPGARSLVHDFLANNYRVATFSGQAEDFGGVAAGVGLRRGLFVDASTLSGERSSAFTAQASLHVDGRILLREFDRHFGRREAWARPNFLYVNFQSAHFPYAWPDSPRLIPGEPIPRSRIGPGTRDWVARTYWNAIAYNDRLIAALLARLRRLGALDDALVVVTADHGESLFDDGFLGHGHALNALQTRIPFLLSDPGVDLSRPLGLADMRAIVLRAAGARVPEPRHDGVFQYLGELERPGMIGVVRAGGRWTRFDLFREALWTPASGRWIPYRALDAEGRAETDALIDRWARERWRHRQG
ncbi:MAG: sulfatase-like hydrolase/transferase [Sphingosinicella sp.]